MHYVPNTLPKPEVPEDDNGDTVIYIPYDYMAQAKVQVTSTNYNTDSGEQFQMCAI